MPHNLKLSKENSIINLTCIYNHRLTRLKSTKEGIDVHSTLRVEEKVDDNVGDSGGAVVVRCVG